MIIYTERQKKKRKLCVQVSHRGLQWWRCEKTMTEVAWSKSYIAAAAAAAAAGLDWLLLLATTKV